LAPEAAVRRPGERTASAPDRSRASATFARQCLLVQGSPNGSVTFVASSSLNCIVVIGNPMASSVEVIEVGPSV
jgi:hypothetical protein